MAIGAMYRVVRFYNCKLIADVMRRVNIYWQSLQIAFILDPPLSVESCQVDIVYDYRNRNNVFRLVTPNRSSYLFDAEDESSMHRWISAIGAARSHTALVSKIF